MNFQEIFEMQKALDKAIQEAHHVKPEEVVDKKILALMVEVGEFANEIKPFKYWKKHKDINRDHVIEEFVDGIHFLVSLGNHIGSNPDIKTEIVDQDQTRQLIAVYAATSKLQDRLDEATLNKAFGLYMGIAELANISPQEVKDFYIMKNKVNYERIANNY